MQTTGSKASGPRASLLARPAAAPAPSSRDWSANVNTLEQAGRRARHVPDRTANRGHSRSLTDKRARRRPASALISVPGPGAFQADDAGLALSPALRRPRRRGFVDAQLRLRDTSCVTAKEIAADGELRAIAAAGTGFIGTWRRARTCRR